MIAFDDLSIGSRSDAERAGFAEIVEGDIRDQERLLGALAGVDAVVHLAAQTGVQPSISDPRLDMEVNVGGTFNVLEAARLTEVQSVVLASSAAPLGASPPPAHEGVVPRPMSPYGASKLSLEAYASAWTASFGLATYVLRFSNVYGPWSYLKGSVVAHWMKQMLDGQTIRINGSGEQTRDFLHVGDVVGAISLAIDQAGPPGLYQLGTGIETSVRQLATQMSDLFGADFDKVVAFGDPLQGDMPRSFCDISLARERLGYEPVHYLDEGLTGTKAWFEEHASTL